MCIWTLFKTTNRKSKKFSSARPKFPHTNKIQKCFFPHTHAHNAIIMYTSTKFGLSPRKSCANNVNRIIFIHIYSIHSQSKAHKAYNRAESIFPEIYIYTRAVCSGCGSSGEALPIRPYTCIRFSVAPWLTNVLVT